MASLRISWVLLVALLHTSLLLPTPVFCETKVPTAANETVVLNGINAYRTSRKAIKPFTENDKATCLAGELASSYESKFKKCVPIKNTFAVQVSKGKYEFNGFENMLKKCNLDPKGRREGVILPICEPGLNDLVRLTAAMCGLYGDYIEDETYLRAGIGSVDDWMVVILTRNTTGSKKSAAGGGLRGGNWVLGIVMFVISFFVVLV